MLAGELTPRTSGLPNESTFGTPAVTLPPVHTTRPKRVADVWRSAFVICGQVRLVVVVEQMAVVDVGQITKQGTCRQAGELAEAETMGKLV